MEPLELGIAPEDRQVRRSRNVAGGRDRLVHVVLELAAAPDHRLRDVDRDPVEHDRRDHLVGPDGRLQEARDRGPERACERGEDDREDDVENRAESVDLDGWPASSFARPVSRHRWKNEVPTQTPMLAPTMYWPWPPMLKRPHRKANATASPVRISGVGQDQRLLEVERRVRPLLAEHPGKNQFRPVPLKIPLNAFSGLWPVAPMTIMLIPNAKMVVTSGVTIPPARWSARRAHARRVVAAVDRLGALLPELLLLVAHAATASVGARSGGIIQRTGEDRRSRVQARRSRRPVLRGCRRPVRSVPPAPHLLARA